METYAEVDGNKYILRVYYENRNNSYASIRKNTITIRIPSLLNREEKFKQLMKLKMWALKKLKENPKRFKQEVQKEYKAGDKIKIGNEEYTLEISFKDKKNSSAKILNNVIHFVISSNLPKEKQNKHIATLLSRCIAAKRLPKLKEKINELNKKSFNQQINKIFFKHNKSNWGSCSKTRNINISTRLFFAPDEILEYVCLHELAHLIEQNHSEKFWDLIKRAMPDYEERKKWLKENGDKCSF